MDITQVFKQRNAIYSDTVDHVHQVAMNRKELNILKNISDKNFITRTILKLNQTWTELNWTL